MSDLYSQTSGTLYTNSSDIIPIQSWATNSTIILPTTKTTTKLVIDNLRNCFLKTDENGAVKCGELPAPQFYQQDIEVPKTTPVINLPTTTEKGGGGLGYFILGALVLGLLAAAAYRRAKVITVNGNELKVNIKWTRKQMIRYGVITYGVVAVLTYGYWSADFEREKKECNAGSTSSEKCEFYRRSDADVAGFFGPLIMGVTWPLYWPLHIATKIFE